MRAKWFAPSFLTGVTHAHRVANEEIFGPVLIPQSGTEEAFECANNIPYGLSAGGVGMMEVSAAKQAC